MIRSHKFIFLIETFSHQLLVHILHIFMLIIVGIGRLAAMNRNTLFTVLLFVLNTNALPYQSTNGIGRFDQDVEVIDSLIHRKSLVERVGRDRSMPMPGGIPISRTEVGKNLNFALG